MRSLRSLPPVSWSSSEVKRVKEVDKEQLKSMLREDPSQLLSILLNVGQYGCDNVEFVINVLENVDFLLKSKQSRQIHSDLLQEVKIVLLEQIEGDKIEIKRLISHIIALITKIEKEDGVFTTFEMLDACRIEEEPKLSMLYLFKDMLDEGVFEFDQANHALLIYQLMEYFLRVFEAFQDTDTLIGLFIKYYSHFRDVIIHIEYRNKIVYALISAIRDSDMKAYELLTMISTDFYAEMSDYLQDILNVTYDHLYSNDNLKIFASVSFWTMIAKKEVEIPPNDRLNVVLGLIDMIGNRLFELSTSYLVQNDTRHAVVECISVFAKAEPDAWVPHLIKFVDSHLDDAKTQTKMFVFDIFMSCHNEISDHGGTRLIKRVCDSMKMLDDTDISKKLEELQK